ncbi:uncharacterized protein PSANT_01445 [Moesziomyces antarcticus]|uniref:Uncharacterized protein n=1 Tax=Pseudozyma antarctica TaxID=84753 RepID=A0A5C3FHS9_PSEA2|nr:uncharacterized protein PSANT_01445 [Moesziomyces antarcticus]
MTHVAVETTLPMPAVNASFGRAAVCTSDEIVSSEMQPQHAPLQCVVCGGHPDAALPYRSAIFQSAISPSGLALLHPARPYCLLVLPRPFHPSEVDLLCKSVS